MQHAKAIKYALASLFLIASFTFVTAQTKDAKDAKKSEADAQKSEAAEKKAVRNGRDPFAPYRAPVVVIKRVSPVPPPSIQERIEQYRAQKLAAMNAHLPAPKPTTALLLNEIQVVGISRTPRGYAAIVEATPIKLSYTIYPGERLYDGQLVAIEDTRLVFRHETVWTDGRHDKTVEMKSLRQPSAVEAMASAKPAPTPTVPAAPVGAAAEPEKKSEDKAPAGNKP
ncbi:MAG TPA: hypothetical protein VN643_11930 [Pyrinomonadaceae bacterium]|nr:hypothetical protein [Pyrinomonadaceae bacterium]